METISFINHNGKRVTRSYKTPEALERGLRNELRKMRIKSESVTDAEERKALSEAMCRMMLLIYNNCGPGRRLYGNSDIEVR